VGAFYYVNERDAAEYTAVLKDEKGIAIPSSDFVSLYLTLKTTSGTVINGRNVQDALNTNEVTITSTGLLTWAVTPLDNQIIGSNSFERHRATFNGKYNTNRRVTHQFHIVVRQLDDITSSAATTYATVAGTVRDGSNNLIESAIVVVAAESLVTTTDTDGTYSLRVPTGQGSILAAKAGVGNSQSTYTLAEGDVLSKDFYLT
jgi:hypothetical protein